MKTLFTSILTGCMLLFFAKINAQEFTEPSEELLLEEVEPIPIPVKQHVFKLNVPSLAVATFSLQYEFFPMNWLSLNLGYKFTPNRGMVAKDKVIDIIDDSNSGKGLSNPFQKFFEDFEFKGNAVTPEIRFYLGEGYGKGFYLGPFARIDHYKFTSAYAFRTLSENYTIDFEGKHKAFGYGLNIGAQFPIGQHFTIDTFIGPYLSNVKIDFHSTSNYQLTDQEVELFREELNEFQLPNGTTDIVLSNSSAQAKLTADQFFNLRVGLAVGYRF